MIKFGKKKFSTLIQEEEAKEKTKEEDEETDEFTEKNTEGQSGGDEPEEVKFDDEGNPIIPEEDVVVEDVVEEDKK